MRISQVMRKLNCGATVMRKYGYNLKKYQMTGVKWMIEREIKMRVKGGILADDPGLGKTIQTMALLVANKKNHTLIVVPTAVIGQWRDILHKIIGEMNVYIHYGSGRTKSSLSIMQKDFSVCLTSHGSIYSHDRINKERITTELHIANFWDRIVIDEGHVIRNHKTKMFKACMMFTGENTSKWILSGTPIQNTKKDIKNLLAFVGAQSSHLATDKRLEKVIGAHLLRRTKEVLHTSTFVPYVVETHLVPFEHEVEQTIYIELEKQASKKLKELGEDVNHFKKTMVLLEIILRLRQCSTHPYIALTNTKYSQGPQLFPRTRVSSKIKQIANDVKKSEGLSLVFCHFREEMTMISEELYKQGIRSKFYNGSMNIKERAMAVEGFNSSKPFKKTLVRNSVGGYEIKEKRARVLIVQIKAGSVGLNLQEFNNVFLMSPDWNPCNEIQAISRAHRMGQKKRVFVHKYVMGYNPEFADTPATLTIDQKILSVQMRKRDLMATLLSDDTLLFNERFTDTFQIINDDLWEIFRS